MIDAIPLVINSGYCEFYDPNSKSLAAFDLARDRSIRYLIGTNDHPNTTPANYDIPSIGQVGVMKYLYYFPGGSLYRRSGAGCATTDRQRSV